MEVEAFSSTSASELEEDFSDFFFFDFNFPTKAPFIF